MIIYLIKVILCTAFFFLLYKSLLENERLFVFNRFYLLTTPLLCIFIPLVTLKSKLVFYKVLNEVNDYNNLLLTKNVTNNIAITHTANNHLDVLLLLIYIGITVLLLFKFCKNIISFFRKIKSSEIISVGLIKIILCKENITPHSFLQYIFIKEEDYLKDNIRPEILSHEQAHVKQMHSYDIILIEILKVFFWFNPLLILYAKAIKLNHEFLADCEVTKVYSNTFSYQELLLSKACENVSNKITSQFNFQITKKRLIMITKTSNKKSIALKLAILMPMVMLSIFLFGEKSFAQNESSLGHHKQYPFGEGATKAELNEYDSTLRNMTSIKLLKNGRKEEVTDMSKCDTERMSFLFKKMNKDQRDTRVKATRVSWPQTIESKGEKLKPFPYGEGATKIELEEYDTTIKNMTTINIMENEKKDEVINMSKCDTERTSLLFSKMNKDQRDFRVNATGVTWYENDNSK